MQVAVLALVGSSCFDSILPYVYVFAKGVRGQAILLSLLLTDCVVRLCQGCAILRQTRGIEWSRGLAVVTVCVSEPHGVLTEQSHRH